MSGGLRIAAAIAVAAFFLALSYRVVAHEAPAQLASLAESGAPMSPSTNLQTRSGEPFGLSDADVPGPVLAGKWQDAERAIRRDIASTGTCSEERSCSDAQNAFLSLVNVAREKSGRVQFAVINRAVNLAIAATSDLSQFGKEDVWSSPIETLVTRKGDCEDYAILKIAVLRAAGVSPDDLRLAVVRDPVSNEGHAVAAARLDGRWLLLDNRRFALVDAAYSAYRPFFALHLQDDAGQRTVMRIETEPSTPYLL
ncbi:MAG TPA: transglutaminase-like cysteine peptidase [Pseudorhodoplanes sp.]|jgi:predicted transglutaminase-like cysteine proteinase|nr:transglutaminase-like cysteine peptidase [Pseudorhodoplanes sp.]